jgi:hypothetical protein
MASKTWGRQRSAMPSSRQSSPRPAQHLDTEYMHLHTAGAYLVSSGWAVGEQHTPYPLHTAPNVPVSAHFLIMLEACAEVTKSPERLAWLSTPLGLHQRKIW